MRSTFTSIFTASVRENVVLAALAVFMLMQACALTEEQETRQEAQREDRLEEIRLFIDECEASGSSASYQSHGYVTGRDTFSEIPPNATVKDYKCLGRDERL